MPKVSVIIPTYNRATLLEKAVQSVLYQTYNDFEIIVCDDASTDNTPQIINKFKDKRIRFTRYEQNKGVIKLRNAAITISNGDYIAFLDDDDEWLPTKLEEQIAVLQESTDKLGAVYTGAYSIDMKLNKVKEVSYPTLRGNVLRGLLLNNFITTSSMVIKNLCFEEVGLFDPEYKSASDFDMWIRIAEKFDFDYIPKPLVNYRISPISISNNYAAVTKGLERLLTKHHELFASNSRGHVNHLLKLGVAYCYSGDTKLGRSNFLKAIKVYPSDPRPYYNFGLTFLGLEMYRGVKKLKDDLARTVRHIGGSI